MANLSMEILSNEKRIINISRLFNLESYLKILEKEIKVKNVGFNITDINKVYELTCGRRDIVEAAFFKVWGKTNGNVMLFVKYSSLVDFITKAYKKQVSCNDFMKEMSNILALKYLKQISEITGSKYEISNPAIGTGYLENILHSPFIKEDIFSKQSFIFLDIMKNDIFECESTFVYIPIDDYDIREAI